MTWQLVWDVPIRLFHWLFAAGFFAAAGISLLLGDDSRWFPYHALIGLVLTLMVLLRIVWGIIGTKYARFGSFAYAPTAVAAYTKAALFGGSEKSVGHNPGSAYAIFAMLALMLALATTGIMMGRGDESVEEAHELLAYGFVGVVIVHILGVVWHTLRHRDNITASMIHGRKLVDSRDAIASQQTAVALIFLVAVAAWSVGLARNFDPATGVATLPLVGIPLQIGEEERGEGSEQRHTAGQAVDDDD